VVVLEKMALMLFSPRAPCEGGLGRRVKERSISLVLIVDCITVVSDCDEPQLRSRLEVFEVLVFDCRDSAITPVLA
jgi:hypothetical protein